MDLFKELLLINEENDKKLLSGILSNLKVIVKIELEENSH